MDCSWTRLRSSEVGRATLVTLGFGCFFFDYDNDGWPDIFVADGHIEDQIERVQKRVSYAEPPHLFRNLGGGKFEEVTQQMGQAFAAPRVARGAAYADIDNDGALDVLMTTNGGRAYLFRNEGGTNHSLRIKLVGTKSNRDGIGAVVSVASGDDKQWKMLRSGSSYLSQSELVADVRAWTRKTKPMPSKFNGPAARWTNCQTSMRGKR